MRPLLWLLGIGAGLVAVGVAMSGGGRVPLPVSRKPQPLPDECDPLDQDTWGAGNICVDSGGRFISVPEATNLGEAPEPGFNQVTFSADLSSYKVGGGWKLNVLDKWLEQERRSGHLVTRFNPDLLEIFKASPADMLGTGVKAVIAVSVGFLAAPLALADVLIAIVLGAAVGIEGGVLASGALTEAIASTGAGALAVFAGEHTVRVGGRSVPINSLPLDSPAMWEFVQEIANYIGRFQGSEYPGDA